jgi:AraC-like DNA-binding protein
MVKSDYPAWMLRPALEESYMDRRDDVTDDFFSQLGEFRQVLEGLEKLPGALFAIKDRSSRYIFMSEGLVQAIQRTSLCEVVGRTDLDLFPKVIAEAFRQNDRIVLEHGQPLRNELHLTCFFKGSPRWSFSSKFPLRDRSGRIIGLLLINELYERVMGDASDLERLLPALDHVTKHFRMKIRIDELASLCKISPSHFMRVFKDRLKMTAHAFVEQVRMQYAMELLRRGNAPITEVAIDCGFYDHSAFVKRFRKYTGQTPRMFRLQQRTGILAEGKLVLPVGGNPPLVG